LRRKKRQTDRAILQLQDENGCIQKPPEKIIQIIVTHLRRKYDTLTVEEEAITRMVGARPWTTRQEYQNILDRAIDLEEIKQVLQKIGRNKTPGSDGIGWEFYKTNWSIIKEDLHDLLNEMYTKNTVTAQQKHGLIVCLPKHEGAQKPTDYCPITLLNVDYKILTKILANRLRPLIAEHIQKNQFCGLPGNTISDALATVRDTTAMAEIKKTPMFLVSLDFQEAFDRISHTYLATILRSYGLSE